MGASPPASAAPGSEQSPSLGLGSHWTWCQGQRPAQGSFPAPTLWQGGSEEAEQQALCYSFLQERIILPAPWHTQTPLTTASKVRNSSENAVPAVLMQKPSFQPTKASGGGHSLSQAVSGSALPIKASCISSLNTVPASSREEGGCSQP